MHRTRLSRSPAGAGPRRVPARVEGRLAALVAALVAGLLAVPRPAAAAPPAHRVFVSPAELAGALNDPHLVILHVGAIRSAYDDAHLPGARFLPLSAILAQPPGVPNELPPAANLARTFEGLGVGDSSRVVVYGDLGGVGAARVYWSLSWLGHERAVSILDGGLAAWTRAGHPTSPVVPRVTPGHLTVRRNDAVVARLDWVHRHLGDPKVLLVDSRPPSEYAGDIPGGGIRRAGHLPGAKNLPWETTLTGPGMPLATEPLVRRQFQGLGVRPGTVVVAYCRTGIQAAWLFAVARWLGYDARLYDGSFTEWSRRTNLPVAR